jgi:hypothetical protein
MPREPEYDDEGNLLDDEDFVDWGKVDVRSRASHGLSVDHPLGDASRWGGYVEQTIVPPIAAQSNTIVRAQTLDMYPRTWTALGTLKAPDELWALEDLEWLPLLELRMGIGQNTVRHLVNLRNVAILQATVYQAEILGGFTTRPWFMGGGILATNINIRVINLLPADIGGTRVVTTSVQLAPLAAGTGL